MNRYRVSILKLKSDIKVKTQNVNAKHSQCQCIVSGRSCGHSPYIFHIYLFFSGPQFEKTGFKNFEQSLYLCIFMVLNFDYGIQLSLIHVSKCCLMVVTFYLSVVIVRGGG